MSAFIVTRTHIDAIVTTLFEQECSSIKEILKNYGNNQDLIGLTLWNENYKSVNYRYEENDSTPQYIHRPKVVKLMQSLKAIDCLNYQSCEHPDYRKSEANKILSTLKDVLLNKMKNSNPEYEAATWSID